MKFLAGCFVFVIALCGAFAAEECSTMCTMEYNPQCGLGYYDGKFEWGTYGNPCGLRVYNCQNPNKQRYALTGLGDCTNILPTATTDPPPKPVCDDACPFIYQPVCGIGYFDGSYHWSTQSNGCALGVYNCHNPDKQLHAIENVGECTEIFPTANSADKPVPLPRPTPIPRPRPQPIPREYTIQPYSIAA